MQLIEWRDLFQSKDADRALAIATVLASMEYDAAVEERGHSRAVEWVVSVRSQHWPSLIDVIDEIVLEQDEFDDYLDGCHRRETEQHRRFLLAITILVSGLAAVGLIRL